MKLLSLIRDSIARFSLGKAAPLSLLALLALPSPLVHAQDAVTIGSSVTFIATAEGLPAPSFQWRKNGNAIPGATAQTYTIPAASLTDAGLYQVVATNSLGSATSPEDELLVASAPSGSAPVITSQPVATQSVTPGSSVTFSVAATGTPAPTYQWLKNGGVMSGWTNATLTLSSVSTNDSATYAVVVSNSAGSVTSNASVLTVASTPVVTEPPPPPPAGTTLPVFTTQPVATLSAPTAGSVTLTVSATGTPAPAYQWLKNGAIVPGWTSATLTMVAVTTNDTATYSAMATNSAGTATSTSSLVTITPPGSTITPPPTPTTVAPVIYTQPASQTVAAGATATFTITAEGVPAPTFQWRKNGVNLAGATTMTFKLTNVTGSDAATYSIVATNSAGTVTSSNATLTVTSTDPVVPTPTPLPPTLPPVSTDGAPKITGQPVSQTVTAGSSTNFTATASGTPTPTFQWRKNGVNIAGATAATLSFRSVTTADAAGYSVIASNSAGSAVSDIATMVVQTRPTFTTQPAAQAVAAGAPAKFSVVVSAIPGATYQWRKNGVAIAGATNSTLSIGSVAAGDTGSYSVVATNTVGSTTSSSAALVLATPPVISRQPVSQVVSARANVSFSSTASGSPAPTYQWKKNGINISGATAATLTLKSVSKSDEGAYTVVATNLLGWVQSNKATLGVIATSGRRDDETPDDTVVVDGSESRLVNLSVRATAGTGSNNLIVGFVVDGAASKPVLIRGIGPTLREFGVAGALLDPSLSLYTGSNMAATNDDWMGNDNASVIASMSAQVGAFSLPDRAADSALMTTLQAGAYTAQLSSKDAAGGVALVEVYDAASGNAAKLVNLSVRAQIGGSSEAPNVGFVIAGTAPKRVLIRAVGPALGAFGVTGVIADPQLEVFRGATRIEQNDNWGGDEALGAIFNQVGAFGIADRSSRDAVLFAILQPGAYTVVVSGVNGSSGVGLVELYEVP